MKVPSGDTVQQIGLNSYVVKCAFCEGRGLEPVDIRRDPERDDLLLKVTRWSDISPCRVCDGRGLLRIESDDLLV